jgi:acyl-[acyl-carrier-protein]-phospholipid O-acyltransferase/long-chain-fatty-acid--[acyl-carrier-protein] ligase
MTALLKTPGFLSFISMIFLNAFVDLGHKIIIQNTVFKVYDGATQIILTAIVNGLILLPFILLFTPSGFLADHVRKTRIMQWSAIAAVALTLLITFFYYLAWFEAAFAMTFMLAVQSAFYSPAKYGYIREIAGKDNLASANSVVQSITIIAILMGMFVFSILFEMALAGHSFTTEQDIINTIAPIGWLLVVGSIIELYLASRLPDFKQKQNTKSFDWQHYRSGKSLKQNLELIRFDSVIWLSIIGLSVFWGVSQVVLATFPAYAKEVLATDNTIIIQGLLACAGIGIVLGSLVASKVSRHYIETGLIPIGALGMIISLTILPQLDSIMGLASTILAFGLLGGLFIIPLNALIQFRAKADQLGTVLAGNNWIQNVVMLTFLILTMLAALAAIHSIIILYALVFITFTGAIYTILKLPQSLVHYVAGLMFSGRYRITVQGLHYMPSQGAVLMLGNHISWLDWAIIQIASPRPIHFVMDKQIYKKWYLTWFLDLFSVIPLSKSSSKEALVAINQRLQQDEVVCLFPEESISQNGQLGEFKKGFERCIDSVNGVILPFYLRGLWGSRFSRSGARLRQLSAQVIRRDIIVGFGEPLPISSCATIVKQAVFDLSIQTWQGYTDQLPNLGLAWIQRAKEEGGKDCLTDIQTNTTFSRRKILVASLSFSRRLKQQSRQNIGLLLPTSSVGLIANIAIFISGKTAVNLNFTANIEALTKAVEKAGIDTIYTSHRFISSLEKKGIKIGQVLQNNNVVYIENLTADISQAEKLLTLIASYLPAKLLQAIYGRVRGVDDTAALLFSSGTEGTPKGIMLSHRNIISNIKQVSDVLDTSDEDILVASLPLFHAFGLTVTGLMPLIEGIPAICHSDPADVLSIAKGIHRYRATIFCGTSTFLRLFYKNSHIHPLMLDSLRITVAGAERLSPEVRTQFSLRFGKTIYEGYGTTETAPVATFNIPDRISVDDWHIETGHKTGSVGLPLPGTSVRIVDPETLETLAKDEDGLILIGGTQLMQGYLDDPKKTAEVIVVLSGLRWYKTGDKGHLDDDGFLTVVARYSGFAKRVVKCSV